MTTAGHNIATADDLAAAAVYQRLHRIDGITIRRDPNLRAPYAVNEDDRLILVPPGLAFHEEHSRINRCWLYLLGGTRLATEFAGLWRDNPDRHHIGGDAVIPFPIVRRAW